MRTIFRKAINNRKAENYPFKGVEFLEENNARDRVLSEDEYNELLANCPEYVKPIVRVAYHTGMRLGEILNMRWGQLDLKEGFIDLPPGAKNKPGRLVPLNGELLEMFKAMPRGLPEVLVFMRNGKPISSIREGFESACRKAEIKDFTFHDLRHTFVTNMRRAAVHDTVIMAITGHKTVPTFHRYVTVSREDLTAAVKSKKSESGQYLDSGL
jgi:integrase